MKDVQTAAGDLWGRLKGAADRRRDGCQSILEVQRFRRNHVDAVLAVEQRSFSSWFFWPCCRCLQVQLQFRGLGEGVQMYLSWCSKL